MKKSFRALCLAAALLLIGLLLAGLIFAFLDTEWSGPAVFICLFAVLILSVLLYGIRIVRKHSANKKSNR